MTLFKDSVQFSSVTQLCPTLCDPMDCNTPGLPVYHQLPEFTLSHVHQVGDATRPSHWRTQLNFYLLREDLPVYSKVTTQVFPSQCCVLSAWHFSSCFLNICVCFQLLKLLLNEWMVSLTLQFPRWEREHWARIKSLRILYQIFL